jgi:predicted transcriptional regulator YheO
MAKSADQEWILGEAQKIATALAETFAPLCEVVVHDLTDPEHTIVQISNNLSGRAVGDAATEMGLARMTDPTFPDVVANYANRFSDGRPVKSTSVGLRDKSGVYIAAICLNVDLSYLHAIGGYLSALTEIKPGPDSVQEVLSGKPRDTLLSKILAYAAKRNRDPRALTGDEKRDLLKQLSDEGELEMRGAAEQIGAAIGVSRSNVYYYLRDLRAGAD